MKQVNFYRRTSMKKAWKYLIILSVVVFCASAVPAEENYKKVGIGFVAGAPTGLDAKLWFSRQNALDIIAGWGYWNVWAQATYQWHYWDWYSASNDNNDDVSIPLYIGLGGYAGGGRDKIGLGPIGTIGIDILLKKVPFDIFVEMGPAIQIAPETGIFLHGGLGARYYLP
jgi:hypothetical protein